MERKRFQTLVRQALDSLPEEFRAHLENVAVVIEDRPAMRAGDHQQAVRPPRARRLQLDVPEVRVKTVGVNGPAPDARAGRIARPDRLRVRRAAGEESASDDV